MWREESLSTLTFIRQSIEYRRAEQWCSSKGWLRGTAVELHTYIARDQGEPRQRPLYPFAHLLGEYLLQKKMDYSLVLSTPQPTQAFCYIYIMSTCHQFFSTKRFTCVKGYSTGLSPSVCSAWSESQRCSLSPQNPCNSCTAHQCISQICTLDCAIL